MLAAILILFFLPFFKVTPNSIPTNVSWFYKLTFWLFIAIFLILMFLGGQPAAAPFVLCSKAFTCIYFGYLILIIPILNFINTLTLVGTKQKSHNHKTQPLNFESIQVKRTSLGHKL